MFLKFNGQHRILQLVLYNIHNILLVISSSHVHVHNTCWVDFALVVTSECIYGTIALDTLVHVQVRIMQPLELISIIVRLQLRIKEKDNERNSLFISDKTRSQGN